MRDIGTRAAALLATVVITTGMTAGVAAAQEMEAPASPVAEAPADPAAPEPAPEPVEDEPTPEEPVDPAPADPEPGAAEPDVPAVDAAPDLQITIDVDPGPYAPGFPVTGAVTVSNVGDGNATDARLAEPTGVGLRPSSYPTEWSARGSGTTLEAGAVATFDVNFSHQAPPADGTVTSDIGVVATGDSDETNNVATFQVTFAGAGTTSAVTGTIFGDTDADGALDVGEQPLAGVTASLSIQGSGEPRRAVTGADGRFEFADVPAGYGSLYFEGAPDGWVEPYLGLFSIGEPFDTTDMLVAATRPYSDKLALDLAFTERVYQPGDTATVRITLTNKTAETLTGIKADCNNGGGAGALQGAWTWQPFRYVDDGATLGPNETATFERAGTVPAEAATYGHVFLVCFFGPSDWPNGNPRDLAAATVPGEPGDIRLRFYEDRDDDEISDDDEFLSGVPVTVTGMHDDVIAARGRTGADGRIAFENLPAGLYRLDVYGPWRIDSLDDFPHLLVVGSCEGCGYEHHVPLVPGPDVPEPPVEQPDPSVPPTTTPPPAQGSPAPGGGGLASTGANVLWLAGGGVLVLALGVGAVLATRRRQA